MKNIIKCDSAPAALGPYSHACEANGFIFTSGQLGIPLQASSRKALRLRPIRLLSI